MAKTKQKFKNKEDKNVVGFHNTLKTRCYILMWAFMAESTSSDMLAQTNTTTSSKSWKICREGFESCTLSVST